MQVAVLCGGTGTRMQEVTELTPKPLVPIGGKPMLWHIMHLYMHYGFHEFVLALGFKQETFKMYFTHFNSINHTTKIYNDLMGDMRVSHPEGVTNMDVTLVDTGLNTLKGERLRQLSKHIKDDTFLLTYGDGLSDVNLLDLVKFHQIHGCIGTITGVRTQSKFGEIEHYKDGRISKIVEKPKDGMLTNGGFMVFNRKVFNYLWKGCDLEVGPLERLARDGELYVYEHKGFWKNADTMKDIGELQAMWDIGETPWLVSKTEKEDT